MSQFKFSAGYWNVHEGTDAFGLVFGKLWEVHLNDQNEIEYD
jgi:hypothetical protein